MIFGKVRFVQSVIVEHDTNKESAVLLLPGAQCAYPDWYAAKRESGPLHHARWEEALRKQWNLKTALWQSNRFLMITNPNRFHSVYLIWEDATDRFLCYYVNFQLPLTRSHCGFDTYDLELDIVVKPNGAWQLKDEAAFEEGVRTGVIKQEWAEALSREKESVIANIESGIYPFNNHWRSYDADPSWKPPSLPKGWDIPEMTEK